MMRNNNSDDEPRRGPQTSVGEMVSSRVSRAVLPAHEQLLDRLADLLYDTDEALDLLTDANTDRRLRTIAERPLREVYERIDSVMKHLSD